MDAAAATEIQKANIRLVMQPLLMDDYVELPGHTKIQGCYERRALTFLSDEAFALRTECMHAFNNKYPSNAYATAVHGECSQREIPHLYSFDAKFSWLFKQ
jgi:hypothetical protein